MKQYYKSPLTGRDVRTLSLEEVLEDVIRECADRNITGDEKEGHLQAWRDYFHVVLN